FARIRRHLAWIVSCRVREPDPAWPGTLGVEHQPGPVRRIRWVERVVPQLGLGARRDLSRPDVPTLEVPASEITGLELAALGLGPHEHEARPVRGPGGLNVISRVQGETTLLPTRHLAEDELTIAVHLAGVGEPLAIGGRRGPLVEPRPEGDLRELAVEARRQRAPAGPARRRDRRPAARVVGEA